MKQKNTVMKPKKYNKKKKNKSDDLDDLVYHDALEHHVQEPLDIDEDFLPIVNDEDVDLVEDALAEDVLDEDLEEVVVIEEDLEPKKKGRRKTADKSKFYVDPKEFDEEIVNYYKSGKMSNNLAEMVSKISHKLSYAPNFINYTYREEMVGDGVIRMMKALMAKKYNRDKGTNPFSYFTRIAFNAFRNRIKKEKHMAETHEKYQNEIISMSQNYNTIVKNNNLRIGKERDTY